MKYDPQESVAFRQRSHSLQQTLDLAKETEKKALTAYKAAQKARRDAQKTLEDFLEADARPVPLFDRLDEIKEEAEAKLEPGGITVNGRPKPKANKREKGSSSSRQGGSRGVR